MSIGARIRQQREKQSLNLKELAELSNMPVTTLSEIERGISTPRADNLRRIIIALGCSADLIMFDDDEMTEDAEIDMLIRELKSSKTVNKEAAKEVIKALLIKARIDELN